MRSAAASRPSTPQSHGEQPAVITTTASPAVAASKVRVNESRADGAAATVTASARISAANIRRHQLADFLERGHAVQRAEPRAADGGRGVRNPQRLVYRQPMDERVDEAAAEDV